MTSKMTKIIRASTVPGSLDTFCRGLLKELREQEGYEVVAVSSPGPAMHDIEEREGCAPPQCPWRGAWRR